MNLNRIATALLFTAVIVTPAFANWFDNFMVGENHKKLLGAAITPRPTIFAPSAIPLWVRARPIISTRRADIIARSVRAATISNLSRDILRSGGWPCRRLRRNPEVMRAGKLNESRQGA